MTYVCSSPIGAMRGVYCVKYRENMPEDVQLTRPDLHGHGEDSCRMPTEAFEHVIFDNKFPHAEIGKCLKVSLHDIP